MKKLLLFDIDGTILNMKKGVSKKIFIDTFFDIYGSAPSLEQMPHFAGNTDLKILNQMADTVGIERSVIISKLDAFWEMKLERFKQFCTKEYVNLTAGADSLLEDMDKNDELELFLVTGNSRKNSYQKLASHNLDRYFTDGAFGCEQSDRNLLPPMAIRRANDKAQGKIFSEENTLIIGDTPSDIMAAKLNHLKIMMIVNKDEQSNYAKSDVDSIMSDFLDKAYFYEEINRIFN